MVGVRNTVEKTDSPVQRAGAIFAEHGEFIRRIIRFQAGGRLNVEDLYQEFYLLLVRKPVPADVRNVRSYLYQTLVHHVIDAVRSRNTYAQTMKKYAQETRISINNEEVGNAFIKEEHRNAAVAGLARHLPDREAQAFVMKYRDDCDIREIATRMGINKRTVSRYLSESLRRLHRRLAAE